MSETTMAEISEDNDDIDSDCNDEDDPELQKFIANLEKIKR